MHRYLNHWPNRFGFPTEYDWPVTTPNDEIEHGHWITHGFVTVYAMYLI